MATVPERARSLAGQVAGGLAAVGRFLRPAVVWLAAFVAGLLWSAVYVLLRGLEDSKRVSFVCAAGAAVAAGVMAGVSAVQDAWLMGLFGLVIGCCLVYGTEAHWVNFRRRLVFLAEAHPRSRSLLIDGPWYRRLGSGRTDRRVAWLVSMVAAVGLTAWAWGSLTADTRGALAAFLSALAMVWLLAMAMVVVAVERRHEVAYFLRGWRIAEPGALEERLAARWPKLAPALAWRARWGGWLGWLAGGLKPLRRAYGECQE